MTQHIVIVEDEKAIADNYRELLTKQGYSVTVFPTLEAAREGLKQRLPDLAILDVGLGSKPEAGFELCAELRQRAPQLPIVFLTARDTEIDVISGFRLGADDYLTKDISQIHLLARITALLRRVQALRAPEHIDHILTVGALQMNSERLSVTWKDRNVPLTFTEFRMLESLARHPGHVKNRQQLMDAADVVLDDNTITSHIRRIRKKFVELDAEFDRIETAYGVGYRWLD